MTIAKQMDFRSNLKKYFDMAFSGEPVIIPRKENRNVVILSEKEYKAMEKARNNEAYLKMLEESERQLREGKVIEKTMEELLAMEDE
ncbi:type II toxin-antitoxin system Phd/YefM family antitoxin [uncultured Treponema sp.]|uniref:type II toxin-antitoxin system Phd/YefM family antitoxin n=1 Tax=uncultured Treponema sp. TaxID=162155 RepID=UPI0025DEAA62|nr:type II toxin-antitoxin system Phd/YefM family antitoxin [uncultured Treponema sp.]MBQ4378783.1 type II toxin-antitoxin system Phd/YefM family antitoxin [Treponema sp.]